MFGGKTALRVFEQSEEQIAEHGGLYWCAKDGTVTHISRILYTESDGPIFKMESQEQTQLHPDASSE